MVLLMFFQAVYFGHFLSFYTMQLEPSKEVLVRWKADYDMPGISRLVGLRLYNKNVAFCGFGGGRSPLHRASSHNHPLSSKTTYATK